LSSVTLLRQAPDKISLFQQYTLALQYRERLDQSLRGRNGAMTLDGITDVINPPDFF
jgi:hypothetical protein